MHRSKQLAAIEHGFKVTPIVALLGARQCGKTTLAREYAAQFNIPAINYFDLEAPEDIARLTQPKTLLEKLRGLIVIDEIQRCPELFPLLRVLIDSYKGQQRYLILGSASPALIRQSSESLAGRIYYQELSPFSYDEVNNPDNLWLRGGYPVSYLAANIDISYAWREQYIKTFLEQDIPNLGIRIPAQQLSRFWYVLAHYNGCIFNASEIGRTLGLTSKTMSRYLDILVDTFMVRRLKPWFENISKRQVKMPKIYFRDTGILHNLLSIYNDISLQRHPKLGLSWESFALEQVIRISGFDSRHCYFWATQTHAELDLLVLHKGQRLGFEFKYNDAPKLTKSMRIAIEDLKLDSLTVIYPGEKSYALLDKITVMNLKELIS